MLFYIAIFVSMSQVLTAEIVIFNPTFPRDKVSN